MRFASQLTASLLIFAGACGGERSSPGTFAYPVEGAINVDTTRAIAWNLHPEVSAYRVRVESGVTPLATASDDWLTAGEVEFPALPFGAQLRLTLEGRDVDGSPRALDTIAFTPALAIRAPLHGSRGVESRPRIEWSPAAASLPVTYSVSLGSAFDQADLGGVTGWGDSAWQPPTPLPADRLIYLRVVAQLPNGDFHRADSVFAVGDFEPSPPALASNSYPLNVPLVWSGSDLDSEYSLKLYRGSSLAHDSGLLHVRKRFLSPMLPVGEYEAELGYRRGREWRSVRTPVRIESPTGPSTELDAAFQAAVEVHDMASPVPQKHLPRSTTTLFRDLAGHAYFANCQDYAETLLHVLREMNVGFRPGTLNPRKIHVGFILNGFDGHTLVEGTDMRSGQDVLLDPTFLLTFRRGEKWASREDLRATTARQRWDQITYVPLDPRGPSLAQSYYLDLPLLFLNIDPLPGHGKGQDPRPWMEALAELPAGGEEQGYVFETETPQTFSLIVDGSKIEIQTLGHPALSRALVMKRAERSELTPSQLKVWRTKRYVF